jgi:hypothetical protein
MARVRTATRTGVSSRRKVVTCELENALSKPAAKMAIRTAVRRRSRAATTWMPVISVLAAGLGSFEPGVYTQIMKYLNRRDEYTPEYLSSRI